MKGRAAASNGSTLFEFCEVVGGRGNSRVVLQRLQAQAGEAAIVGEEDTVPTPRA
jgi:hypothetical protein